MPLPRCSRRTTKHVIAQTEGSSKGSGDCWKVRVRARRG